MILETSLGEARFRMWLLRLTTRVAVACSIVFVPTLHAEIDHSFKLDHFGYQPLAQKVALVTRDPGATVEVLALDGSVVFTVPTDGGSIDYLGFDGVRSGDTVWEIDFTPLVEGGTYELSSPTLGSGNSYPFDIRRDVYTEVTRTALRAFYMQRCGTPKRAEHVGVWADEAVCHSSDVVTGAASGHTDRGIRDLSGGWHDAGDYNKYVWGATSDVIWSLLTAYERNPKAFGDDLGIPESGNGIPDVLDEVRWELDWMRKMQLPDGSVLQQMRGVGYGSPPSADGFQRGYHDPDATAAGVFAGSLALAARVFLAEGLTSYASTLKDAALLSWQWLQGQPDSHLKVWAAAEILRGDPNNSDARSYVEGYNDWYAQWFEMDAYEWRAAAAYLKTPSPNANVRDGMKSRFDEHVSLIFSWNDSYGAGMADWQYYWGSNRPRALYGLFLLEAAELGFTADRSVTETQDHARDFLHYLHGRNPLNMLYLTNMRALGGEHSSFQAYHAWFADSSNPFSVANYFGLPFAAIEEDYPYFKGVDNYGISDDKYSALGPPPGLVPGGPNSSYGENGDEATPPVGSIYYDRYYRDWADQTIWTVRSWEISEPSISYQGPYVALASAFVDVAGGPSWDVDLDD